MHWDRPHEQLIFTSRGGSASAYALNPAQVGPFPELFPDYVPSWVPPPTRDIIDSAPAPDTEESEIVAHDWGHIFRQAAGVLIPQQQPPGGGFMGFGQPMSMADPSQVGPVERTVTAAVTGGLGAESCEGMVWAGGTPPKGYKVVNFCGQGVLRKVRRRRRRRLLTASDKADISYIVATTGKGQLAASLIHRSAQ